MGTFGNAPGSWSGWESWYSDNPQVGQAFTAPETGTLTEIHCYVAHEGGAAGLTLAVWFGDTIIASGTATAAASGGASPGAQSWCSVTGLSASITAGNSYWIGWQRSTTDGYWDWSWSSGGTFQMGPDGSWSGTTSVGGSIGAYVVYTTGGGGGGTNKIVLNGAALPGSVELDGSVLTGAVFLGSEVVWEA